MNSIELVKKNNNKSVSLILGSGGARGLAHIGVIDELERRGFRIEAVVGCSIGSIVGGAYCAGKIAEFERWVSELSEWDVLRFLDVSLTSKAGMMKGDLVSKALRQLLGSTTIEELPIRFAAVATDIEEQREVWLNSGLVSDAIRASIAIPGMFTPHQIDGRQLVDGGLLNPLPVAPAMFDKTDLTVAVSLAGPDVINPFGEVRPEVSEDKRSEYQKAIDHFLNRLQETLGLESGDTAGSRRELGLTDVMLGMFDTMQATISRYRLASYPPDVLIEIPRNICKTHEFHKAKALIGAGRHWASRTLDR